MWWDPSRITLLDSVLFSLLSLFVLYFIGWGFLRLISRFSSRFSLGSFNFFQKVNIKIFFGFTFLFLSSLIFSIFSLKFLMLCFIVITIAVVGFLVNHRGLKFKIPHKFDAKNHSSFIVVLVVVLVIVFLSSSLISGLYGSTNDDGADHTLMTRIILDNPNALISRSAEPYAHFYLRYPSATHVASAFFVSLMNVQIQKVILMLSAILPVLIALAFYSTVKSFFENRALPIVSLVIAGFLTISLFWGPIGWAGLPLLLSFYLSISGMGFIFVFLIKENITIASVFLLGSIFFIASQTYPVALLFLGIWFLLVLGVRYFLKFRQTSIVSLLSWRNLAIFLTFLAPLILSLPYFYFNLSHNFLGIQEHNLGLIAGWAENIQAKVNFNWLIDLPALSGFFSAFGSLLGLVPLILIIFIAFFALFILKRNSLNSLAFRFVCVSIVIYVFMLSLFAYLSLTLNFHIDTFTAFFDPQRVWVHIFIAAVLLTSIVIFSVGYLFYLVFSLFYYSNSRRSIRISKRVISICLLVLLAVSIGSASVPVINDQQFQYRKVGDSLNNLGMLGNDDLALMYWIKDNVPMDSSILVSASDSGQYVTSVTQRQTISMLSNLENYSDLIRMLTSNASDLQAVRLLLKYNISYVYVGSRASTYALEVPYYHHFNSSAFLETNYFVLIKQFGAAWLFKFNSHSV